MNGTVANQETIIFLMILRSRLAKPRASPTPMTDPTSVWVVEIGNPSLEQIKTTVAAPNSEQKPREGVISVIFFPIVSMTREPQMNNPMMIQVAPRTRIHNGIPTFI